MYFKVICVLEHTFSYNVHPYHKFPRADNINQFMLSGLFCLCKMDESISQLRVSSLVYFLPIFMKLAQWYAKTE